MTKNTAYFLIAPNPDKRVHDLLMLSSRSSDDLQKKAVAAGVDISSTRVILGEQLTIGTRTLIEIGEPQKRRGRPPGARNRKGKRKAKKIDAKVPGNQRRKIVAKSKRKGKKATDASAPGSRARGRHSGETQAERNARVETAS